MKLSLSDINRFVNSRPMVAVTGILLLLAARIAFQSDDIMYFTADKGILFPSPNLWFGDVWLKMAVNTALILATAIFWILLIQIFNPFRALTTLQASFFIVMMMSVPDITDQFCSGTLLAALMPAFLGLLWSSFANYRSLRHIYLIFTILSALTMTQYCFAVYIPVFILGCLQMKIFSLRSVIACVLGLVTPWWIVYGLGLDGSLELHMPGSVSGFFASMDTEGVVNIVAVSVVTIVLLIFSWLGNFMNVVSMNVKLRAFNGSISLIAVFTLLAMLVDFNNATAYLPTLMAVTSYQLAFMFGKSNDRHSFIAIIGIMLIYVALFVIRILL